MSATLAILRRLALLGLVLSLWPTGTAWASPEAETESYAIVVGTNAGGAGQEPLQFAEQDAQQVAEVLRDLGGYAPEHVRVLLSPDRTVLDDALGQVARRIQEHQSAGERSQLFFYYSGHAKAHALHLGQQEFDVNELRQRLLALEATLTVVVLDACQSGAFSRIKGAEPASDFSFNSVNRLNTQGLAVMASSTATELSQESSEIRGSYFTHHLLVGMRGAGDANTDGRVTLDEAYSYAYNQTLNNTARTAVGPQHATLEKELRGKGDVPLTYPAAYSSQLVLPTELEGRLLIQREPSKAVLAEVYKAAGSTYTLALPPGRYQAALRREGNVWICRMSITDGSRTTFQTQSCVRSQTKVTSTKHASAPPQTSSEAVEFPWGIEFSLGLITKQSSAYTQRLADFGFRKASELFDVTSDYPNDYYILTGSYRLHRFFSVLLRLDLIPDMAVYEREVNADYQRTETFSWAAYGLGAHVRAGYPLFDDRLTPYLQAGLGLSIAQTHYRASRGREQTETDFGYQLTGLVGLRWMPWRHFGFLLEWGLLYAPTLTNELDEKHDVGGMLFTFGIRTAL